MGRLRPRICRDKEEGWVDERALCLSSFGYHPSASPNPDESCCNEDKHKAPTLPRIHPLSLHENGAQLSLQIKILLKLRSHNNRQIHACRVVAAHQTGYFRFADQRG